MIDRKEVQLVSVDGAGGMTFIEQETRVSDAFCDVARATYFDISQRFALSQATLRDSFMTIENPALSVVQYRQVDG